MRALIAAAASAACAAWLMPACGGRAKAPGAGQHSGAGEMSTPSGASGPGGQGGDGGATPTGGSIGGDEEPWSSGESQGGSPYAGGSGIDATGGLPEPSNAGGPDSAGRDTSAGGTPDHPEQATCDDFLGMWRVRQSEREPGEPIPPPSVDAPCFDCIRLGATECHSLSAVGCSSAEACLERHCLCTSEEPVQLSCSADDYPTDLCDCTLGCIPSGGFCESAWLDYARCIVGRCGEACAR
jgi:hypothetical protein